MRISDWSSDVCSSDLPIKGEGLAGSADRRFHDLARLARRLALGQRVDIVHAFDHLAPDGVLIVEEARVLEADEELTVRAVRVLRARHRADAADVRFAVKLSRQIGKLAAAHDGARRVAALRHEAGDHAVKDEDRKSVVKGKRVSVRGDLGGGSI